MKALLIIITAVVVCIYLLTKPTAEDIKNDDIEEVIIDSSGIYLNELENITEWQIYATTEKCINKSEHNDKKEKSERQIGSKEDKVHRWSNPEQGKWNIYQQD